MVNTTNGNMVGDGSVTTWLRKMQGGDSEALAWIWRRYYPLLVRYSDRCCMPALDSAVDSEDLVQSAFGKFCIAVVAGKYSSMAGRCDLWNMLAACTLNRVRKHLRFSRALKRLPPGGRLSPITPTEQIPQNGDPNLEVILEDLLQRWLCCLDSEDPTGELRQIAIYRLQQFSADPISRITHRRKTIVLAKMRLIELIWDKCEKI